MNRYPDSLDDAPWFVKFVTQVGISTAAAAILLWFLLTSTTVSQKLLAENDAKIVENQTMIIKLLADHADVTQKTLWVSIALCVNAAKSDEDRTRCVALERIVK